MAIESSITPIVNGGTEYPESESKYAEINKMSYILRDMSMNAVAKFEKLYQLPSNILSDSEKQFIADHFQINLEVFRAGLAGTNVSTVV